MRAMRRLFSLALIAFVSGPLQAEDTAAVRLADGFQNPVGLDGKDYYRARGMQPNGHLGDDWNGTAGGEIGRAHV